MYITKDEINTHLYGEQISAISGTDETELQSAINAAIIEAAGYLSAFDHKAEFAKQGNARNALLIIYVKDIAVWHYINKCNVNTDLQLRAKRYDDAIAFLNRVQKGAVQPGIEPLPKEQQTGIIISSSNPKRNNHY